MRDGAPDAQAALSRPGRYQQVRDNLRVKEVRVGDGDAAKRFIVCHNPGEADRDKQTRDDTITRLEHELTRITAARAKATNAKASAADHRAECALRDHPTLGRYVRQTKTGRLLIDRAKIKAEQRLDGKYLLSTSDPDLSAEDVALGYKNLLEAERGFRDLKSTLELRPVFHRVERRIRAHVLLLARPLADPRRRTPDQPDMATHRAGTAAPAPRHADWPDRQRAAHHRPHPGPARDPRHAADRRSAARHRAHPGLKHPSRRSRTRGHTRANRHKPPKPRLHKGRSALNAPPHAHQLRNSGDRVGAEQMGVRDHPVHCVAARVLEHLGVLTHLARPQRREVRREALGEAHRPHDQTEAETQALRDLHSGQLLRGREGQICLDSAGGGHGPIVAQ